MSDDEISEGFNNQPNQQCYPEGEKSYKFFGTRAVLTDKANIGQDVLPCIPDQNEFIEKQFLLSPHLYLRRESLNSRLRVFGF